MIPPDSASFNRNLLTVGKVLLLSFMTILLPYYLVKLGQSYELHSINYPNTLFAAFPEMMSDLIIAYGFANLVILPAIQGFIIAREAARYNLKHRDMFIAVTLAADLCLAALVLHEGIVCIIMASPLLLGIMVLGVAFGETTKKISNRIVRIGIMPLVVLFTVYDASTAPKILHDAIIDSIVINAPPDTVWKYLTAAPVNTNSSAYWLWQAGLPAPNQLYVNEAHDNLEFRLSHGIKFIARITKFAPQHELAFAITEQAHHPEVYGHISFDRGSFTLHDNGDNTTTLTATGHYSVLIAPSTYFNLWMIDIIHHVHARVFTHIKSLAESEKRKNNI